jgi:hypothetical protein
MVLLSPSSKYSPACHLPSSQAQFYATTIGNFTISHHAYQLFRKLTFSLSLLSAHFFCPNLKMPQSNNDLVVLRGVAASSVVQLQVAL